MLIALQALRSSTRLGYWSYFYAKHEQAFLDDFARAFQRMLHVSELSIANTSPMSSTTA